MIARKDTSIIRRRKKGWLGGTMNLDKGVMRLPPGYIQLKIDKKNYSPVIHSQYVHEVFLSKRKEQNKRKVRWWFNRMKQWWWRKRRYANH